MPNENETETTAPEAESGDDVATDDVEQPETVHGAPVTWSRGDKVAHPSVADVFELVRTLRDADAFNMCVDVTAVDYLSRPSRPELPAGVEPERFEVVYQLLSHERRERLRLRVQVPVADPTVPSIFDLHPGVEAMEREVFDLFGITFTDHPDLTRILMPEDWIGHPLRKDYGIGAIPVQFKGVPSGR